MKLTKQNLTRIKKSLKLIKKCLDDDVWTDYDTIYSQLAKIKDILGLN